MEKHITQFFLSLFLLSSCEGTTIQSIIDPVDETLGSEYYLNQPDSCNETKFDYDNFDIIKLKYSEHPYFKNHTRVTKRKPLDNKTLPLHIFNGLKNYHPVYITQYGLHLINVFNATKDSTLLKRMHAIADKLYGISLELDSSLFLPYSFSFPLHGYQDQVLPSPWYSAMAQGQALSFYCRLFTITKSPKYLEISKKLFNSFGNLKASKKTPWVSCIDSNKNLWLEEYPMGLPCFTLNGMIFGIYGVYDYYLISNDEQALLILKASITTIKNNIEKFRNENDLSYYCLKHKVKDLGYHKVHIEQLEMLSKITGEKYFLEMSEKFNQDLIKKTELHLQH